MLKVVFLTKLVTFLPKGQAREMLSKEGRIKDVPVRRSMSATEVIETIISSSCITNASEVEYLQAHRDNTLKISADQNLDGDGVIRLAGSGSLYVIVKKGSPLVSTPTTSSSTPVVHTASSESSLSPPLDTTLSSDSVTPSTSSAYSNQLLLRATEVIAELQVCDT